MDQALVQRHWQPISNESSMLPCFMPEMQLLLAALRLFRQVRGQR